MKRTLIAAAFAVAMLPALAVNASAGPIGTTYLSKTYTLGCSLNQWDGTALKGGRMMVKNTTGHIIPEGTKITVKVRIGYYRSIVLTETAYRYIPVNDSLSLIQPPRASSCTATVTLTPNLKSKVTIVR